MFAFNVAYDSAEGSIAKTLLSFPIAAYKLNIPTFAPMSHRVSSLFKYSLIHWNVSGSLLSELKVCGTDPAESILKFMIPLSVSMDRVSLKESAKRA